MTPRVKHLLSGLGLAAVALCALPMVADSFGAVPAVPAFQINRAVKNDRLMVPNMTVAKRKVPTETVRRDGIKNPGTDRQRPRSWTAASRCSAR